MIKQIIVASVAAASLVGGVALANQDSSRDIILDKINVCHKNGDNVEALQVPSDSWNKPENFIYDGPTKDGKPSNHEWCKRHKHPKPSGSPVSSSSPTPPAPVPNTTPVPTASPEASPAVLPSVGGHGTLN